MLPATQKSSRVPKHVRTKISSSYSLLKGNNVFFTKGILVLPHKLGQGNKMVDIRRLTL